MNSHTRTKFLMHQWGCKSKRLFEDYYISGLMSILGFYFPPETGEKVTLEITILVACVFFLNIVSDMQPPSSNIPLISTYFTCVLIMVACSVVRNKSYLKFLKIFSKPRLIFCSILLFKGIHNICTELSSPTWY